MPYLISLATLVVVTFLPGLELRASLPLGFFNGDIRGHLTLPLVILVCLLSNIGVGMITFLLMRPVELILRKWSWFEKWIWPRIEAARDKLHPHVEKHGEWGLALFIGIPLPGTGAYAGGVGAYLLGFRRGRFWLANARGVTIACLAVLGLCFLIDHGVVAEESLVRRVFMKSL